MMNKRCSGYYFYVSICVFLYVVRGEDEMILPSESSILLLQLFYYVENSSLDNSGNLNDNWRASNIMTSQETNVSL